MSDLVELLRDNGVTVVVNETKACPDKPGSGRRRATMGGQARQALNHMRKHGNITRLEAMMYYRISDLPSVILDLRTLGYLIETRMETDHFRAKYARYYLIGGKEHADQGT